MTSVGLSGAGAVTNTITNSGAGALVISALASGNTTGLTFVNSSTGTISVAAGSTTSAATITLPQGVTIAGVAPAGLRTVTAAAAGSGLTMTGLTDASTAGVSVVTSTDNSPINLILSGATGTNTVTLTSTTGANNIWVGGGASVNAITLGLGVSNVLVGTAGTALSTPGATTITATANHTALDTVVLNTAQASILGNAGALSFGLFFTTISDTTTVTSTSTLAINVDALTVAAAAKGVALVGAAGTAWTIDTNAVFIQNTATALVPGGANSEAAVITALGSLIAGGTASAGIIAVLTSTPGTYDLFRVATPTAHVASALATTDTISLVGVVALGAGNVLVAGNFIV